MARIAFRGGETAGVSWPTALCACLLAGCRVLSLEEDSAIRARRTGALDATAFVADMWGAKALPAIHASAVPLATLGPAVTAGLDRAGAAYGRRAGEGSAWTFVVRGAGRVVAVDTASRRGAATIAVAGWAASQPVQIQIGPVVEGSAIRDALPFVAFDDFSDQLAFADVGRALTARAVAGVRPQLARLRPGQGVRFVGVANVREAAEPLMVTPVSVAVENGG